MHYNLNLVSLPPISSPPPLPFCWFLSDLVSHLNRKVFYDIKTKDNKIKFNKKITISSTFDQTSLLKNKRGPREFTGIQDQLIHTF